MSENAHAGHRQRLRKRFLKEGSFENFDDHVILEMLLFYAIPQKDTNALAHRLLKQFGSLYEVFEATVDELMEVDGVSENIASFVSAVFQFNKAYIANKYKLKNTFIRTPEDAVNFFTSRHKDSKEESFSIACLDSNGKVISFDVITTGAIDMVITDNRETVRRIVSNKAVCAAVCHNHPSGVVTPSKTDVETTRQILALMRGFGVMLVDHVIISGKDAISMKESAFYGDIFYDFT